MPSKAAEKKFFTDKKLEKRQQLCRKIKEKTKKRGKKRIRFIFIKC